MKLSKLVLAGVLMCGSIAFAQDDEVITDAEIQENYAIQCGTLEEMGQVVGQDISTASDADKKELQDIRQVNFDVLVGGQKAIQKLLDEGSKSDTGGFGAVIACTMVDQMSSRISEKGCLNIATGETTKGEAGIAACKAVLESIKAKQK
ncbi:hypothetical protein CIK05_03725 [Bdellovibrio sp. qaytius]|nr:hypothetical protein CIK05_03725 [Bdellovibrio sp. qaytius]